MTRGKGFVFCILDKNGNTKPLVDVGYKTLEEAEQDLGLMIAHLRKNANYTGPIGIGEAEDLIIVKPLTKKEAKC
jgi:hypothetical protein